MTKQHTCRHCGGEIEPGHGDRDGKTHFNHFECIRTLRRRAEEAEALVRELTDAETSELEPNIDWLAIVAGQRDRAEARLAELTAQPAARQWRLIGGDIPLEVIEIRTRARVYVGNGAPAVGTEKFGAFVCHWADGNGWEWRFPPLPDVPEERYLRAAVEREEQLVRAAAAQKATLS